MEKKKKRLNFVLKYLWVLIAKNFDRGKMSVFLQENLYIAYLEVQETNVKIFYEKQNLVKFCSRVLPSLAGQKF